MRHVKDVVSPWHYFGGGANMKVKDKRYRLSFVKPNGAMAPYDRPAGLESIKSIAVGRGAGKAWKAALTE